MPDTRARSACTAAAILMAGLLAWPIGTLAQLPGLVPQLPPLPLPTPTAPSQIQGQASAVQATVLGVTAALASTGALSGAGDALDASMTTGSVPSLVSGEALSASTMAWQDEVDSAASITNLGVTVGTVSVVADSVVAEASSLAGTAATGSSAISGLSVNGAPIAVSGAPNQVISILGGQIILNEQNVSPNGIVVNAIHVIVPGADFVIASATAGIA